MPIFELNGVVMLMRNMYIDLELLLLMKLAIRPSNDLHLFAHMYNDHHSFVHALCI